jgi:hypothetical protein
MGEPKVCAMPGCCAAVDEIATLRAENNRLADESHNARQAANGENALRLDAERERDDARGSLEKQREYTKLAMRERDDAMEDTKRLDWIATGAEAYQQRGFYLRNDGLWAVVGDINDFGKALSLREAIDEAREERDDD